MASRHVAQAETDLRCAFDLKPIPPRRRARREAYCSDRCRRETQNYNRRAARKAGA